MVGPVSVLGYFPIPIGQQFTGQDSTAYSVFAELTFELNDQWTLSAGARYSYEEKEAAIEINHFAILPVCRQTPEAPL